MDASIIVTTYNQAKLLNLILFSLVNQETKYIYEIIVCDDGGVNTINSTIHRFNKDYPHIPMYYLWQQDKRFRAGQARNMGIRQSIGDVIILLDGDMIPTINFVQRHINFHKKNPNTLLSGNRKVIDDKILFNSSNKIDSIDSLFYTLEKKSDFNKEELGYRKKWYKSTKPWMSVFSCNLSFTKNSAAKYCEDFIGWGIEDWDFSLRLYKAGYHIKFSENILAYHIDYKPVISNAFRNNNHLQMVEFARNVLLLLDQYPDENLDDCALALNHYKLIGNKWSWAGDNIKLRENRESIKLLRVWLKNNNLYSKKRVNIEPVFKATVIVACFQHFDYFEKILYSLIKQFKYNFELIIVDDGSNNKTIKNYQRLLNNCTIPSKIIWQPNNGFRVAKSRNNGIKQSLGKTIIFLDGDMIPSNNFIQSHIEFHSKGNNKVLAGNRLLISHTNFKLIQLNKHFFENLKNLSKHFTGEEKFRIQVAKSNKYPWRLGFTCNLSIQKSSLLPFDENIQNKFGHEDLELMYRLYLSGCKFSYNNRLIAYHIGDKKPGYAVHEGATNKEIINHMLTSLYVVNKHNNEPFMWAFLDCTRYFYLNKKGQWCFSLKNPKSFTTGLTDFSVWLLKNGSNLGVSKR